MGISAELPEFHVWKFTNANSMFVSSFLSVFQSFMGYIVYITTVSTGSPKVFGGQ
jgi:hypothetical protein